MDKKEEIPIEEGIMSWFQNVYLPVINAINENHIMHRFKKLTISDLYIFFTK
jgi:hypothetical protein